MEITKQNESFNLKESTDLFEMTGTANKDVSGSLHIHFNVNNKTGEHIGNGHYNKHSENSNVSFGVDCPESKRAELMNYAETIIDSVLEHFK